MAASEAGGSGPGGTPREEPIYATFLCRPNRFIAAVELDGRTERVHVPNTGRMSELLRPGARVVIRRAGGGRRKTRYDLWAVWYGDGWVCVDARAANDVAWRLLSVPALSPLVNGATGIRREARFGGHRFDLAIQKGAQAVPVEVKSVNLVHGGVAMFPDAPTMRGARHVRWLARWAREGGEAHLLFVVQRGDAHLFRPNRPMDPEFADALAEAHESGVGIAAVGCRVDPYEVAPVTCLPVDLGIK